MAERQGDDVYKFQVVHFGVHPQASVSPHQCPSVLVRRLIDRSHCRNLHFHIGDSKPTPAYHYCLHVTADIRTPTLRVGDTLVYDGVCIGAQSRVGSSTGRATFRGRPGRKPTGLTLLIGLDRILEFETGLDRAFLAEQVHDPRAA